MSGTTMVNGVEIGPDGKEWAKTEAGYAHATAMVPRADYRLGRLPSWHGWALREAFVVGAEWQEKRFANEAMTDKWLEDAMLRSATITKANEGTWADMLRGLANRVLQQFGHAGAIHAGLSMAYSQQREARDAVEPLRAALAAGPTKGPWLRRKGPKPHMPSFVQTPGTERVPYGGELLGDDYEGVGGFEQREKDVAYVAACDPDTIRKLLIAAGITP